MKLPAATLRAAVLALATAIVLAVPCAGAADPPPAPSPAPGKATLKVIRKPQFYAAGTLFDVSVNGEKLGNINGQSFTSSKVEEKEVTYTVAADGLNTVTITTPGVGVFKKVATFDKQFKALPGSITKVVVVAGTNDFNSRSGSIPVEMTVTTEAGTPPAQAVSVVLDRQMKSVVLKESPPIRLAAGTRKLVEDTVRVRHEVRIASHWKVEGELRARADAVWASASLRIRAEIEKSTSTTLQTESERRRNVTVEGGGTKAKKVVWVEYYRTGRARMLVEGKEIEVPFEFREDFDLLTEDAD